jgi:hypothetical protein
MIKEIKTGDVIKFCYPRHRPSGDINVYVLVLKTSKTKCKLFLLSVVQEKKNNNFDIENVFEHWNYWIGSEFVIEDIISKNCEIIST